MRVVLSAEFAAYAQEVNQASEKIIHISMKTNLMKLSLMQMYTPKSGEQIK